MSDYNSVREQAMELWGKTVQQLEDLSRSLIGSTGLEKLILDQVKLTEERDKLFKRIGEEVVKLSDKGKVQLPASVQKLADRLEQVISNLLKKEEAVEVTAKMTDDVVKKVKKEAKKVEKDAKKAVKKVQKKAKKTAKKAKKKAKKSAKKAKKTVKKTVKKSKTAKKSKKPAKAKAKKA